MKIFYKNWWVHNLLAHPLMQIIQIFSKSVADDLHSNTLPKEISYKQKEQSE